MRPAKEEARRGVLSAFPVGPAPERLIQKDSPEALAAQAGLSGRKWTEASAEFLEKNHYYLTREAWAYYLPARLLAALEGEARAWPFSISVAPDMWQVLHGGDEGLSLRLAQLDDARYKAAVDVLWALMDTTTQTGRWCAKALRYGWDQRPSAALDAARAYLAGLNAHRWPPHEDPAVEALIRRILEAFSEAPYPGDDAIANKPEHCCECAGYHVELRGYHWRTMHPDVLKVNDSALSFLSPAAFRFFLPAWLLADLHKDGFNTDPVFHLTYGVADGAPPLEARDAEHSLRKLSAFSAPERAALAAYLRFKRHEEFASPREAREIVQALERFWDKPV